MSKKLESMYNGELDLNGFKISCAVLEDGQRVLVNRSLSNALGIKGAGAYWQKKKKLEKGALLPEYISARYLQPYIADDLRVSLTNPIPYINNGGVETEGVPAELLADICDVYIKANEKGALSDNQQVAENAYKILLAFSKVGIIALVDEATGYQYDREKDELQKILKAYISDELLPWQKRFPDVYYKELFRLNGWDFTVNGIRKRPGVIGKWTNTLIYDELPKGVLDELKRRTPISQLGNRTVRYHQFLTLDVGEPNLNSQIGQVITLFRLSDNMEHMWKQFEKLKSRKQGQLEIPFDFDEAGHTIEPLYDENKLSDFDQKLQKGLEYNLKDKEAN
ncbi:MAG TPA: hypothetical protein DC024_10550 [Clostridiales bacterium]|jgi:hypothetical protein|nr:hypothetical protein [Clostridiales bacterium]